MCEQDVREYDSDMHYSKTRPALIHNFDIGFCSHIFLYDIARQQKSSGGMSWYQYWNGMRAELFNAWIGLGRQSAILQLSAILQISAIPQLSAILQPPAILWYLSAILQLSTLLQVWAAYGCLFLNPGFRESFWQMKNCLWWLISRFQKWPLFHDLL